MIKNLKLKESIMKIDKIPIVNEKTILKEALEEMNKYEIGISCVVNTQGKLIGIITDGDIRRKILRIQKPVLSWNGKRGTCKRGSTRATERNEYARAL